ncbi:MAG: 30S ribosomal protein S17 [bacterium]
MSEAIHTKKLQGTVVSDKRDKTRTVLVTRTFRHPMYHKVIRKSKKYHAHDEKNSTKNGDLVEIQESRPLSRLKRWRCVRILKKSGESKGFDYDTSPNDA